MIPRQRLLVIDCDATEAWAKLEAAGLPDTFTVDSPTDGHGHIYGVAPDGIDMSTIPGTFEHGEIRRFDPQTGTASMVLGPWATLPDGRLMVMGLSVRLFGLSSWSILLPQARSCPKAPRRCSGRRRGRA